MKVYADEDDARQPTQTLCRFYRAGDEVTLGGLLTEKGIFHVDDVPRAGGSMMGEHNLPRVTRPDLFNAILRHMNGEAPPAGYEKLDAAVAELFAKGWLVIMKLR